MKIRMALPPDGRAILIFTENDIQLLAAAGVAPLKIMERPVCAEATKWASALVAA